METVRLLATRRDNIGPWYEEFYAWVTEFGLENNPRLFINGDETAIDLTHREKCCWSTKKLSVEVPGNIVLSRTMCDI